jgi:rhodanese-related sulfurtransferase
MEQLIEFSLNHPFLIGTLVSLVLLLLFVESKQSAVGVSPLKLVNMVNNESAIVIDIREKKEYQKGSILNSVHIPFTNFQQSISKISHYKDTALVIVDSVGHNSTSISQILKKNGFKDISRLKGGIASWTAENLPLVKS